MKKQELRQAVQSIRWTQEQRSRIEEILSQPYAAQTDAAPAAGERAVSSTVSVTHQDFERVEAEEMKFKKHQYIGIALAAAALLLCGGIVGAVAHMGKGHNESSQESSKDSKDSKTDAPEIVRTIISPKLTDQQDKPEMRGYAVMDSGMFFLSQEYYSTDSAPQHVNWLTYQTGKALSYYDRETGQCVYLCTKPGCLHDGNEYCSATTVNYKPLSDPVWLDGSIYLIAEDRSELIKNPDTENKPPVVLLRYAPDGSEIAKVTDIFRDYMTGVVCQQEIRDPTAQLIAHRGQLWMSVCFDQEFWLDPETTAPGADNMLRYGGYQLCCYEPETQKLTTLTGTNGLLKSFDAGSNAPSWLSGYGDYVYFQKDDDDWQDAIKGKGIYRLDCRTGEITQVTPLAASRAYTTGRTFTFLGDKMYYYAVETEGSAWDAPIIFKGIRTIDLNTLKSADFLDFKTDIAQKVWPEFSYDNPKVQQTWYGIFGLTAAGNTLTVRWETPTDPEEWTDYAHTTASYTVYAEDKTVLHQYTQGDLMTALPEDMLRSYIQNRWWQFSEKQSGGLTDKEIDEIVKKYEEGTYADPTYRKKGYLDYPDTLLSDQDTVYVSCEFGVYRIPLSDFTAGNAKPELAFWKAHLF